ncbi:MAG: serine/threonine protein kinase [Clostridium chrysemydis]|uniref:serine/threonine protein kinase n=1 Tax=Clostridium chrysemydis TaxID=2665504 RepID=UPI003F31E533
MGKDFLENLSIKEVENNFTNLKVIKKIKAGGEGLVFETISEDNILALKVYSPKHLSKRNDLEVKKLSIIKSPYIIKLYDFGIKQFNGLDCFYTLTSFIKGQDLRKMLNDGYVFSESEVIELIKCISSAISALWNEKVVHCDIKPDNILYIDGKFILIDLGIAKYIDEPTMTEYGIIMGTLGYIAPEQVRGRRNLTQKADYYSLGIVAYEMLVGKHPFDFNQDLIMNETPLPTAINEKCKNKNLINTIYKLTEILPYKRPFNHNQIIKLLGVM